MTSRATGQIGCPVRPSQKRIMNSTFKALLERGVPNKLARNLVAARYTLGLLQTKSDQELKDLGLSAAHVAEIRSASRPPIPDHVFERLLRESRETCCICQLPSEPVVVHHIEDWAKTRSHEESNLAVICPNDHARAHFPASDKRSLSSAKIRGEKSKWKLKVETLNRNQHRRLVSEQKQARWFWVNLQSLSRLTTQKKIRLRGDQMPQLVNRLRDRQFIDGDGNITPPSEWKTSKPPKHWFLDFIEGMDMATYLSDLLDTTALQLDIIDINLFLDNTASLRAVITPGMYVSVRADFDYQVDRDYGSTAAETHLRVAEARKGRVVIRFSFDSWNGLSMSSKGNHLLGRHEQTVIGQVSACNQINDETEIVLSALGTSPDFEPYHPSQGGFVEGQNS